MSVVFFPVLMMTCRNSSIIKTIDLSYSWRSGQCCMHFGIKQNSELVNNLWPIKVYVRCQTVLELYAWCFENGPLGMSFQNPFCILHKINLRSDGQLYHGPCACFSPLFISLFKEMCIGSAWRLTSTHLWYIRTWCWIIS